MNTFKLKEHNDDYVSYLYRPEDRGEWGEILYIFAKGFAKIVKRASENSSRHDGHAISQVEKFVEKQEFPQKATQAWY